MKRVNVSVDPQDYEALETIASANGLSTALLIRTAMKHFIAAHQDRKTLSLPVTTRLRGAQI